MLDEAGHSGWDPIQNKIGCLAHTMQLILGMFIDALKVDASNDSVLVTLKKGKIAKVVAMSPGFKKVIEKVSFHRKNRRNGINYMLGATNGCGRTCKSSEK